MKLKTISLVLFLVLVQASWVYAAQEEVKLATYYPAPYGEYKDLEAENITVSNKVDAKKVVADRLKVSTQRNTPMPRERGVIRLMSRTSRPSPASTGDFYHHANKGFQLYYRC